MTTANPVTRKKQKKNTTVCFCKWLTINFFGWHPDRKELTTNKQNIAQYDIDEFGSEEWYSPKRAEVHLI